MKITYTLTHNELMRRFAPPMPLRERLPLLASPLLAYVLAYVNGFRQAIVLDLVAGIYGIVCLLTLAFWVLKAHNRRANSSATCLLEISSDDFVLKDNDNPEQRHPWMHLGNIADLGDYLMFDNERGQHLAVIPKSAFDNNAHAQAFFIQSRQYWEAAKQKQQKIEGSWPPAPRPGA